MNQGSTGNRAGGHRGQGATQSFLNLGDRSRAPAGPPGDYGDGPRGIGHARRMEPRDFKGYDHQEQFERAQGLGHGMGGYAGGRAPEEAWGSLGGGYGEQTTLQSGPRSWNVRTATGDPRTRRGPKNYKRSDERIQEDVCERLADHEDIDATEIEVRVEGGEVYLSGSVDTRREKHLAEDVAATVMGVTDVTNGLRVARGPSQGGS